MALKTYRSASGKAVSESLAQYGEKGFAYLSAGLYAEGQKVLAASLPLVPVDTGTLRASGYVTEPMRAADLVTVEIGYGGPAAKINPKSGASSDSYAIFVHENLEAHHPVGQAKYLEQPLNEALAGMPDRLGAFMRGRGESAAAAASEIAGYGAGGEETT